jgi:hypothetical protein
MKEDQGDLNCFRFARRRAANDLMENCLCEVSGSSEAATVKSV